MSSIPHSQMTGKHCAAMILLHRPVVLMRGKGAMVVYEDLTVALIMVLAAATTIAIYVGLLGMSGQFHVVGCDSCRHHMTFSADGAPRRPCAFCRHRRNSSDTSATVIP